MSFDPTAIDAGPPIDAPATLDAAVGCARGLDETTLALYTFDEDSAGQVLDARGDHHGTITGAVSYTAGPSEECGLAMAFDGTAGNYAVIDNAPAWLLDQGSLDFWLRLDAYPPEFFGVVSKDANGTDADGHLTVFVDSTGRLISRMQEFGAENNLGAACSVSGAIAVGAWNHVAVNFGGPAAELWLNGELVNAAGEGEGVGAICQTQTAAPMNNVEPWVFGMTRFRTLTGEFTPEYGNVVGAIDSVRISSRRRDYSDSQFKP